MPEGEMTEDEVAAVHEAAHAVFAVFSQWTRLAGPVVLKGPGHGDVTMSTDGDAIREALRADPEFDRDLPRLHLIRSLLAGPIAERMLLESGRARLSEADVAAACEADYANVSEQLDQLGPRRPDLLLARLERDVRQRLEQPPIWSAVEQFATILLARRGLDANEAAAILDDIRAAAVIPAFEPEGSRRPAFVPAFLAIVAMAIGALGLVRELPLGMFLAGLAALLVGIAVSSRWRFG